MADEDKEKAEKLAAAKRRFEQLKKQQKGKKTSSTGKKKDENTEEASAPPSTLNTDALAPVDEHGSKPPAPYEDSEREPVNVPGDKAIDLQKPPGAESERTPKARKPSISLQSRQRSESFRQGSLASPIKSPTLLPLNAGEEVQEVYRKQVSRIEELERENRALKDSKQDADARLVRVEEELEELRERSEEVAELRSKAKAADGMAKEVETLTTGLASLQRQLSHAQQTAAAKTRRISGSNPATDLNEQLASKTSTIESLEIEVSNLRSQLNGAEATKVALESTIVKLEQRAETSEASAQTASQELQTLKASLSEPKVDTSNPAPLDEIEAARRRVSLLESDLRTAQASVDEAARRATGLQQKVEALTKLHKESTNTTQARDREIQELRSRISSLDTNAEALRTKATADEDLDNLEDESHAKLVLKIRELETENFDLRRGAWREKRTALQPDLDESTSPGYEDIDLNASSTHSPRLRNATPTKGSSFQDVWQSGIAAFTGARRVPSMPTQQAYGRKQSMGLLSEDGFDEDAFAMAQEEEARKRVERIREVKRGLEQWRGWRVDIADMRSGGLGSGVWTGPVFDV
ncbi:hypothetical protein LTR66_012129 [Elasticomyces elasticus]|nr:hypothetical protein LTR66_012129 [Elasticomyces elasticus]